MNNKKIVRGIFEKVTNNLKISEEKDLMDCFEPRPCCDIFKL